MPVGSVLDRIADTDQRVTFRNGLLEYGPAGDRAGARTDAESIDFYWRKAGREINAIVKESRPQDVFSFEGDEVESLLDALDKLERTGRIRPAIQKIFATMNAWLCQGRFDLCRKALEQADPKKLGPDLALSFLTITFAAKQWLNPAGSSAST